MRNRAGIEPCAFDFEMHCIINNDSILLQIFFKESSRIFLWMVDKRELADKVLILSITFDLLQVATWTRSAIHRVKINKIYSH